MATDLSRTRLEVSPYQEVSLFISTSSYWFGGNNRASYMDFFAFLGAVASSLSLKFDVTNEFKMAEGLPVERTTFP